MTFVAQPYEQFVDDLLTALTGGVAREEHQFRETDDLYRLAAPEVDPRTIVVFGQHNEEFLLFERGTDYVYSAEKEGIVWQKEKRRPDEHSFFYVNYYPPEPSGPLTDRNPGSVTTTLAEAIARECAVLHQQMEMIYESAFADLAAGASLDHVAALLGMTRRDAHFAQGHVLFKRNTPAEGDIVIPAGTLVSTATGEVFETTAKRTLRRGRLSVDAPIRAQAEGAAGLTSAGKIQIVNRPVFGIESVTNEKPTLLASEKETDASFRLRMKSALERAGRSTVNAIKYGLIEDVDEISETNILVTERSDVPGFVDVKLGLESHADLVRRVEQSIDDSRAAGIRVTHNLRQRVEPEGASPPGSAALSPGKAEGAPAAERPGPSGRTVAAPRAEISTDPSQDTLPLAVRVFLRLAEPNLAVSQKERIEDEVRANVQAYVTNLPMGADLIYAKLLGRIASAEEILDVHLSVSPKGTQESYQCNLGMAGQKATVNIHDIAVGLMEEAVFLDVKVQVEASPQAQGPAQVSARLRQAIEEALLDALANATDRLTQSDLKTLVGTTIKATDPTLQLTPRHAVVIDAEYEETGRLLKDAEEVLLDPHHVPRLREPPAIHLREEALDG